MRRWSEPIRRYARVLLACIRLFNGTAGLLAPAAMARRLGTAPGSNAVAIYALRLFGVRTIVIGAELLSRDAEVRARSLRLGLLIHASDTIAALIAGARGGFSPRAARLAALISAFNVVLTRIAKP